MNTSRRGDSVVRNADFLRQLARCRSYKSTRHLIDQASIDQLLCIVEICLNLVKDRLVLPRRLSRRLQPHVDTINQLARRRSAQSTRRLILSTQPQVGRGVPALVASVLVPLVADWVIEKFKEA